jgi:2-iminobutanoate/2-iminopropanoate deaminase
MTRTVVQTAKAPQAIGPYSQAIRTEQFIFVSGQVPLNPETGELIEGDISAQTGQVLQNIENVLQEAGSSLAHVVKTTIFITDMDDFPVINAAYEEFFRSDPPARSTIQVAGLPKGARVEIEAIALLG